MSNNEEDNNETRFLGDLLSNANTPTDSTSSPEEMQQRQIYSKGFFDALRAIQNVNNFEFRPATSPVIPPLGTPGTGQSAITPATANDMQQIMLSLLGTPIVGSTQTSTNSTNPPQLLASPTGSLSLDSDMLKLYASAVLPGPPILPLPSPTITKSTTNIEPPAVTTTVPSVAVTAAASTSRPDKLNLPPVAQQIPKMEQYQNLSSDDSDSGYTRSSSRNANSKEMSMDDQERKKLDRKRARNRQAATKCRQKKMDRIRELEEQVSSEKARSARLNNELSQLQSVLNAYRDAVTTHQNRGCRAS